MAELLAGLRHRHARWRIAQLVRDPMRAQLAVLDTIVAANRHTLFGRDHGFASVRDYESFFHRVPVRSYDELCAYLDLEREGEQAAMTAAEPLYFMRTEGSLRQLPLTREHLRKLRDIQALAAAFRRNRDAKSDTGGSWFTVRLGRGPGSGLPTLDTHFFEFAPVRSWAAGSRELLTLDQLSRGREYHLVVTTPSGLYRCFVNETIRVTGFLHRAPLLCFVHGGQAPTITPDAAPARAMPGIPGRAADKMAV